MKGKKNNGQYMLRLDIGDRVPDTIIDFCNQERIKSGFVNGIGALRNVVLAYYSIEEKKYIETRYHKYHELILLKGNISVKENKLFLHAHALIGDRENHTYGGHLVSGEVSATVELIIHPLNHIERKLENETGLFVWNV